MYLIFYMLAPYNHINQVWKLRPCIARLLDIVWVAVCKNNFLSVALEKNNDITYLHVSILVAT